MTFNCDQFIDPAPVGAIIGITIGVIAFFTIIFLLYKYCPRVQQHGRKKHTAIPDSSRDMVELDKVEKPSNINKIQNNNASDSGNEEQLEEMQDKMEEMQKQMNE